jgi:hypothetical protein
MPPLIQPLAFIPDRDEQANYLLSSKGGSTGKQQTGSGKGFFMATWSRTGLRMKIPPSKFQSRNHARPLRSSFWRLCAPALNHLNVRAVGRVCSARVGTNTPQTRSQNYPPDWERLATPTLPNQAGNPAATFMSIQAFFAPDTPALRWVGRRAGVFCVSGTEFILTRSQNYPPD